MAAALLRREAGDRLKVDSAGVYEGGLDPFVEIVMEECAIDLHAHEPKSIKNIDIAGFDRIIALTPEAAVAARERAPKASIEFWDVENPSEERGNRDAVVSAYRRVRDALSKELQTSFKDIYAPS